jgi:hypothetical protein
MGGCRDAVGWLTISKTQIDLDTEAENVAAKRCLPFSP